MFLVCLSLGSAADTARRASDPLRRRRNRPRVNRDLILGLGLGLTLTPNPKLINCSVSPPPLFFLLSGSTADTAWRASDSVRRRAKGYPVTPLSMFEMRLRLGRSGPNLEPGTMRVYVTNGPRNGLNIGRKVGPFPGRRRRWVVGSVYASSQAARAFLFLRFCS